MNTPWVKPMDLVVSGSNCEAPVGAALRVPSYAAPPLAPQISHRENQSILPDAELPPSTTSGLG
jgi:hypothetical protein